MSTPATSAGEMTTLPGDPGGIRIHAQRFTRTATAITDAIAMLKAVRDASEKERSDAVEALADAIGDTRDRLDQLRDRYEVAGSQLTTFADVLEDAQTKASAAISTFGTAQGQARFYEGRVADATELRQSTVDPAELHDATTALTQNSSALSSARTGATNARIEHAAALASVNAAGDAAAAAISRAVDADKLNDSAWDNVLDWVNDNAAWIKVVKDVLTVVTAIVGVLSIFFPVLLPLALGLALVTAGLSFLLASSGDGSWLDFGLDVLGVLTLGVGSAALGAIKVGSVALRGTRAVNLAVSRPGAVFGSGLRQVTANLLGRGLVGSVRQPFQMVARESASVLSARPGLMQVVTRPGSAAVTAIRESGSVVISEFGQVASQARLGAGGLSDKIIIDGAKAMASVFKGAGAVSTGIDAYNFAGMTLNYSEMAINGAEQAMGIDTPIGDVASTMKDGFDFLSEWSVQGVGTDWTAPVAK